MYILKNAFKNITRAKMRNVLIGIIIVVIAASSCVALSIKNTASKLIESYKNSQEVQATLTLNRESMRQDRKNSSNTQTPQDFMANVQELTEEMVKNYGDSSYVKKYHYMLTTDLNIKDMEKVTDEISSNMGQSMMMKDSIDSNNAGKTKKQGDFSFIGYSSLEAMTEFVNGNYKITSGNMFGIEDIDTCVISDELAEENSLSIGDTITVVNPNNEEEMLVLKITGIYTDTSDSSEFSMFSNAANQILVSSATLNNITSNFNSSEESKVSAQVNATFILQSENVVDRFSEELTEKGLTSYYTVSTNIESINNAVEPIKNLSQFSSMFLLVVLIIGGAILVVINIINIRERKYEIGVLRAIGMKKGQVLLQFMIELFVITMISIVIGTTLGAIVTVPVSNSILSSEIESQQENKNQVNKNFGMSGHEGMMSFESIGGGKKDIVNVFSSGSDVEYITKLNAVIDVKTILELMGIGLLLTLVSASVAMLFIARYTPLKILSNRA